MIMTELQKNFLNYTQVSVLADDILKNVEFDALRIVFNQLSHFCQQLQLCCLLRESDQAGGKIGDLDSYYEIEGGETKSEVFQNLAEFQFSCVMFNAVLENACSEQGARMSAMDSSSRNAGPVKHPSQLSSLRLFLEHLHWRLSNKVAQEEYDVK
ncbi:putative ATP synthase, F1 complex, gamma subunit [Helianthus annuus]|nr:putative ATP synthase, F1 complex, gamma subunit [Helianthus annuus]